jgi:signal transduction histidine kinase
MLGLLLGALLPWVGALLTATFPEWRDLPLGASIPLAALTTAWSLFRFRLFDLVPVARAAVLEHMQEGVIVLDAQRHIVDLNLEAQRLIGCPPAQVVGRPAAQVLGDYPDIVGIYRDTMETLLKGQTPLAQGDRGAFLREGDAALREGPPQGSASAEFHVVRDGSRRDFSMRVSLLLDSHARMVGSLVVLQEISAFKRAQEELQRRLRETLLLNRVIAAATSGQEPNAVLTVICEELARALDLPQAAFALLSPERTHLTAVAEYRAEGRPSGLGAVIPLQGNQATQQVLEQRAPLFISNAQTDPRMAQVHDLQRKRGVVSELLVPLLVRNEVLGTLGLDALEAREFSAAEIALAQNVANAAGQALEHARLYADLQRELAERKRAEGEKELLQDQLRQAQKMEAVGLLAGGVAHEFNNLLTVIQGNSELGLLQLQPEQPLHHELSTIQRSAQRGAVLTRQLLAFSRRQTLQVQMLDLNKLASDFSSAYSGALGAQIEMRLEVAPALPRVLGDPGALEQVMMNLALNARDAMPEGGVLRIVTSLAHVDDADCRSHPGCQPGDYVRLTLSDTGVGMDAATREHLFEPFFTTKEVGKGTGLGLSMVYGIVLQHHGWIDVASVKGQGTRFDVYLPVERET